MEVRQGYILARELPYKEAACPDFRRMALNILGPGKGLLDKRRNAAWNEDYLTELVNKFFIKSFD